METPRSDTSVGSRFISKLREDDVSGIAAEIAYRFLFAVFPFGLFVAALGAFVATLLHLENPGADIVAGLGDNLPPAIADALRPELERLLSQARPGLLSAGAIGALWAATGGVNALVKGINRAYDVPEDRPFLLRYAVAIALTILTALGVLASFVTVIGGAMITEATARTLGVGGEAWALIQLARWPVVLLAMTGVVAVLYRYAPTVVAPWRWIFAGSAVFAVGWLISTALLGLYVTHIADYGATYGSLAGVIILMLWFYVSAILLIVGAEMTSALAWVRSPGAIRRRREEQVAGALVDTAAEKVKDGASDTARRARPRRLSRPGA
jgi:membrane protein